MYIPSHDFIKIINLLVGIVKLAEVFFNSNLILAFQILTISDTYNDSVWNNLPKYFVMTDLLESMLKKTYSCKESNANKSENFMNLLCRQELKNLNLLTLPCLYI